MKKHVLPILLLFVSFVLGGTHTATADEVTKWNETASRAAFESGLSDPPKGLPFFEARIYAMTHAAIHDALNAIDRRYYPYALNKRADPDAAPQAAVAAAAHAVLADQFNRLIALGYRSQKEALDAAYGESLASIPDGPAKTKGIAIGGAAAQAILALRAADGWDTQTIRDFNYPQGTSPGEYRFTPPSNFAALPQWGQLRPFALRDGSQYRPDPPYPVNSKQYAADFNEIKGLGGDGVTTRSGRTPEQTEIALFWLGSSALHWNRIARTVSASARLNMWENARMFGLLNLALADGYIGSFDAKYHYNYWRPITAIREADTDRNPDTKADPNWTPLADTPPVPDYDSGHSVACAVAAQTLKRFFGADDISFSTCSTTLPGGGSCNDPPPLTRSYTSFSQAAAEGGLSRILIGFHFRKAVESGINHGRKIGDHTVNHCLRPVYQRNPR